MLFRSRILHRLRGEIGNLGAERFVAASQACEQAIFDGVGDSVPALLAAAATELAQALEMAGRWLKERGMPKESDGIDAPVSRKAFEDWKRMLAAHDMDACKRFAAMRAGLARHVSEAQLAVIDGLIAGLDFEAVIEHLRAVPVDIFDS